MNNNIDYSDYKNKEKKVLEDTDYAYKNNNINNNKNNNKDNNKNMIRSIILLIVLIVLIVSFFIFKGLTSSSNISNNKPKDEITDKEDVTDKDEVKKEVSIIDINSKTRPYAVMINCHNGALPQAGLQDAYIVYEIMVEGGITRMMALFKDKDVSKIGSTRSARVQYLDYVYENDAIYVHAGGAKDALNRISSEGINDIDVDGVYGFRDKNLKRAWEHTLFTSTELLKKAVSNKSFRNTTDTKNLLNYQANSIDMNSYTNIKNANNISIKYSDYRTSNYEYNEESKSYLRLMNNTKNIDLVSGEQYKVKNIIIYAVNYSSYCDHGYCLYQKIDNVGTGEGYYITEGKALAITWKKTSKNSQTKYYVKETGKELILNDGNTYIQIYPTSGNLTIK